MPRAMNAAFMPTTPPPMIITLAAATPGTPPSRIPRPPSGFSSLNAPASGAVAAAPPPPPPPPPGRSPTEAPPRLRGDLARHLAHRREQREPPARVLDRLV